MVSRQEGRPTQITRSSDFELGLNGLEPADTDSRIARAILEQFGLVRDLSVFITSQVPTNAGLGSLTAESVALVKALSVLRGHYLTPRVLADEVSRLEIDELKLPFGRQDPYSISFGGLNLLRFTAEAVDVQPIRMSEQSLRQLQSRLMLFFTGRASSWQRLLAERQRGSERNRASVIEALHVSQQTAKGLCDDLRQGNIESVGEWLDRAWQSKKQVAPGISDAWIDQWYDSACKAGATGGKIVGPGGGGFLLLYCEAAHQERVTVALESSGLYRVDFRFDAVGPEVLQAQPDLVSSWIAH